MRPKEITLEKLRRPARIMKLNHQYDEIDEALAIEMRKDHYLNYRSERVTWEKMRFDYKLSWIIRAQKLRGSMKEKSITISPGDWWLEYRRREILDMATYARCVQYFGSTPGTAGARSNKENVE